MKYKYKNESEIQCYLDISTNMPHNLKEIEFQDKVLNSS